MNGKTKLELTWIGKEERPRLEPRILIEHPEHSVPATDGTQDNILIHGDNLLALKALQGRFEGAVKCIYIDPPFNTQQALPNYDDGIEHSLWLSLMRERLLFLRTLLHEEGTLFVHIDDNEIGYLLVLCDEIFGRKNRRYIVTFKQASATGHKSINPGCVSTTNYILVYAKNTDVWKPNRVFTGRERDKRYSQYIINPDQPFQKWQFTTLVEGFAVARKMPIREARALIREQPDELDSFVLAHPERVIRWARPDYDNVAKETQSVIDKSMKNPSEIYKIERNGYSDIYIKDGQRILFYSDKLKFIDGQYVAGEPLTTLWDDILSNNIHNEGGVEFPKGKKPEALIKRCIELSTREGDLVLDSFAGSGTTGAVAHKMRRRWIMVELGDHAVTHVLPRMKAVISGNDKGGVTEASGWRGGGGFRYFRLASSMLERDRWGNWVVSKDYNPAMLAEAMCRHMGFTYAPSQDPAEYWNHGHSTERDFIYVTTQALTHTMLAALSHEVGPDRRLLICCKAFSGKADAFDNLTIRKIPQAVLANCEWGRNDYSLQITASYEAPAPEPAGGEPSPEGGPRRSPRRSRTSEAGAPGLFDMISNTVEG